LTPTSLSENDLLYQTVNNWCWYVAIN